LDLALLNTLFLFPSITKSSAWRSAVTALFSFVLESESRKKEFALKSAHGGTQEPFFSEA